MRSCGYKAPLTIATVIHPLKVANAGALEGPSQGQWGPVVRRPRGVY